MRQFSQHLVELGDVSFHDDAIVNVVCTALHQPDSLGSRELYEGSDRCQAIRTKDLQHLRVAAIRDDLTPKVLKNFLPAKLAEVRRK